jgi:hypothetical protein
MQWFVAIDNYDVHEFRLRMETSEPRTSFGHARVCWSNMLTLPSSIIGVESLTLYDMTEFCA